MSAFRELGYGVVFFLCAMAGGAVAELSLPAQPQYRHAPLDPVRDRAIVIAAGAIAGGVGWLVLKRISFRN